MTMHDDESHPRRSWLERLRHVLLREPRDREQLIALLHDAKERELLDQDALVMIEGVLKVSEMKVRDAMVPRAQMVIIEHDATPEQAIPVVIESAHSRFPVIVESRDEIIGILLAKDLLRYLSRETDEKKLIKDMIRPVIFIPESKRLNILLNEFRQYRNHMAIVVDEYGGVAGLITIEDVLEQIVGDIEDEYDKGEEEPNIKSLEKNEFAVKATTPINEFNDFFNTELPDEDFDTIGGYLMQQFGHMPKRGESTVVNHLRISVILASNRRLQLLRISK